MKNQQIKAVALTTVFSVGALFASTAAHSNQALNKVLAVSQGKVADAKSSQTRINRLQDQASDLLLEFKKVNKEIDGLRVYNAQLERQVQSQKEVMVELADAIANVTVIQRQIQPLIVSLLDGMEQFIELDSPFRRDERLDRVAKQRANLSAAGITVAEKFRQVIELYNIEAEYARKVDTYPTNMQLGSEDLKVDILAVGRVALFYQTPDGSRTGVWDRNAKQWAELDPSTYKKTVRNGIKMAQKKAQNDILTLPVPAPEAAK